VDQIRRHAERTRHERAELDAVLDAAIIGVLSTVVHDLPLSVPMLYARDGDRLLLHGSTGAGALRTVASGAPAARCVAVLDGIVVADTLFESSANYRSAVVRGVLTPIDAAEAAEALTAISERLIPGRSAEVSDHTKKQIAATLVMEMAIADGHWTVKVCSGPPSEPETDREAWAGVIPVQTSYGAPIPAPWVEADRGLPESVASYQHR
jgi:nitroimidazol reductase NimA-like FMN-containing flavoprotein (pyridoxamine 5'-phosphate oxidase superfamily)